MTSFYWSLSYKNTIEGSRRPSFTESLNLLHFSASCFLVRRKKPDIVSRSRYICTVPNLGRKHLALHQKTTITRSKSSNLARFGRRTQELRLVALPDCVVWMTRLLRTATGKKLRVGLAEKLGLPTLSSLAETASERCCYFLGAMSCETDVGLEKHVM